jgi:hypothetical protein
MTLAQTNRLLIALLAQVTLCLSLAPVIAAQQPAQNEGSKGTERPSGDGLTILAARDAANGRPEEVNENERSKVRRVGRVLTRRAGREEKRRVETVKGASSDEFLSPGTPGEGWGGGSPGVLNDECSVLSRRTTAQHPAPGISHDQSPPLTLPRSTGGGNNACVLLACAKAHPTVRPQCLGDCVQPTGPPAE